MKKSIVLSFVFAAALSLTSCGDKKSETTETTETTTVDTVATPEGEAAAVETTVDTTVTTATDTVKK
jgi:hypothetical protein